MTGWCQNRTVFGLKTYGATELGGSMTGWCPNRTVLVVKTYGATEGMVAP